MVILRATAKVLRSLTRSPGPVGGSDTALGDWYVNRIVVDRQPLLLMVSSTSLLPILDRARDVRHLPNRLPAVVTSRLERLGIPWPIIQAEAAAMVPVEVAKTADRSVLGILVDFAKSVPYYVGPGSLDELALRRAESLLADTPCYAGGSYEQVVFPKRKAPELLEARWGAG